MSLRGWGFEYDIATSRIRRWYVGADGVKRWASDDTPCETEYQREIERAEYLEER